MIIKRLTLLLFISTFLLSSCSTFRKTEKYTTNRFSSLVDQLKSSDKNIRKDAVLKLGEAGLGEYVKRMLAAAYGSEKDKKLKNAILKSMQFLIQRERLEFHLKRSVGSDVRLKIKGIEALAYVDDRLYRRDKRVFNAILGGLRSGSNAVISASISAVIVKRDVRAVKPLIDLLLSKERRIRISAKRGLISIGRVSGFSIIEKFKDPKWKKAQADMLDLLVRVYEKYPEDENGPFMPKLLAVYEKISDKKLKKGIIELITKFKNDPLLDLLLTDLLYGEEDNELAEKIVESLREESVILSKTSVDILLEILKKRRLHEAVVKTLSIKSKYIVIELINALKEAKSIIVKDSILKVLENVDTHEVVSYLLDEMKRDKKVRDLIIPHLMNFSDYRLGKFFISLLHEKDVAEKEYAIGWLKRNSDVVSNYIVVLLEDDDEDVRLDVIGILAESPDKKLISPLMKLIKKEKNQAIRDQGISLLGLLRAEEAIDLLIEEMRKEKETIQMNLAAQSLRRIGKPAVPRLLDVLNENVMPASAYAAYVLGMIGDKQALEPIRNLQEQSPGSGVTVYVKSDDPESYSLNQVDAVEYALNHLRRK